MLRICLSEVAEHASLVAQAVESLKAALSQRRDQRVLFRLGGVLFGLQQYSGARTAYQNALQAQRLTHGNSAAHWL
jgi:hypothetical protein